MKGYFDRCAATLFVAAFAALTTCATCWASPPGPPNIPSTPVGNAEVSAATVLAVAAYGFWKSRK